MYPPGQPWGADCSLFSLPAIKVRFKGLSSTHCDVIQERYSGFVSDDFLSNSIGLIECQAYRLENLPSVSTQDLTRDGQYAIIKIRRNNSIDLTGYNFKARISLDAETSHGSLGVIRSDELAQPSVIENYLRVVSAYKVLDKKGVMLHSAGIVSNNQAYVFSGRSGVGKTTLTRKAHSAGKIILSDDINLLLPGAKGQYHAHKVPFTGEFGRVVDYGSDQLSFPVRCIVLLEQRENLTASSVNNATAVARLLTACPFVNTDKEETSNLFDILTNIVKQIPVVRLQVSRNENYEDIMKAVNNEIEHGKNR